MKNNFYKYLLLVVGMSIPQFANTACGPFLPVFNGFSFLESENIIGDTSDFAPYFTRFDDLYQHYQDVANLQQRNNVTEWYERICEAASEADIATLIYKATVEDFSLLKTAAKSKNIPIDHHWAANSFAIYLKRNECVETIDYLLFAKRCEPHVVAGSAWDDNKKDYDAMKELIHEGMKLFRKTKSHYLKLRYAYQIIRLAHYRKEYEKTLDLYDYLMPKVDEIIINKKRSLIYWWIMGHQAGALMGVGRTIEANYLYSRIFDRCPSRRESAFRSFVVRSDADWQEILKRCKTDHERAVLYALRAHSDKSSALDEMRSIYALDPNNHFLEVILSRDIKRLENQLLGSEWNDSKALKYKRKGEVSSWAMNYVIELQAFARQLRVEKKVARVGVWQLAEGYLELLAGDYYAAEKTFNQLEKSTLNEAVKDQLATFRLLNEIAAWRKMSPEIEERAYEIMKDEAAYQQQKDFPEYLRDKMTILYEKADADGKAFRIQYTLSDLAPNPQQKIIDGLLKVARKEEQNRFEKLLIQNKEGEPITHQLWDMQAVMALQDYQLEAALVAMKEIPRPLWDEFGVFDPFLPTIHDCIECPHTKDTLELYNRGEMIEELLELEFKAKSDVENAAQHYFKIGTALYNLSYWGHAWEGMDYFRTGYIPFGKRKKNDVYSYYGFPFGNKENVNTERALHYFERARILANNKELAAQASFMAAKCQFALYLISEDYQRPCNDCIPILPEEYREYFEKLIDQYSETHFFQRMIDECLYFQKYALK